MARELLLAQSSDWAFQIYQGTTVEYSSRRFQSHIHRFDLLYKALENGEIDEDLLTEIESRDNIFREIDYAIYRSMERLKYRTLGLGRPARTERAAFKVVEARRASIRIAIQIQNRLTRVVLKKLSSLS